MILCWFAGDAFKTLYYVLDKAPIQLVVCALFQLVVDCLILMQIWFYNKPSTSKPILADEMVVKINKYETDKVNTGIAVDYSEENSHLVPHE